MYYYFANGANILTTNYLEHYDPMILQNILYQKWSNNLHQGGKKHFNDLICSIMNLYLYTIASSVMALVGQN